MSYELAVTQAFGQHKVGTVIRDPSEVEAVLASRMHKNVVKRFVSTAPAAAAAAEIVMGAPKPVEPPAPLASVVAPMPTPAPKAPEPAKADGQVAKTDA